MAYNYIFAILYSISAILCILFSTEIIFSSYLPLWLFYFLLYILLLMPAFVLTVKFFFNKITKNNFSVNLKTQIIFSFMHYVFIFGLSVFILKKISFFFLINIIATAVFLNTPLILCFYVISNNYKLLRGLNVFACSICILALYSFIICPYNLKINKININTHQNLDLKILHLSDLQLNSVTSREQRILDFAGNNKIDLIFITGDFLASTYSDMQALNNFLKKLKSKYGIYMANGNMEYLLSKHMNITSDELINKIIKNTKIKYLKNKTLILKINNRKIQITGLDYKRIKLSISENTKVDYKILLYHSPDIILNKYSQGYDLILTGHTHGGQIKLPFFGPIVTFTKIGRKYASGLFKFYNNTYLYVSKGIGSEGITAPRIRFLIEPEITYFNIN